MTAKSTKEWMAQRGYLKRWILLSDEVEINYIQFTIRMQNIIVVVAMNGNGNLTYSTNDQIIKMFIFITVRGYSSK